MKSISMVEFRNDAESIIRQIGKGQRFILTYRGKPVARLEPAELGLPVEDDPFYHLHELADAGGKSVTNEEIDGIVYGD